MTLDITPAEGWASNETTIVPIREHLGTRSIGLAILDPGGKHCREHWRVVVLSAPHASKWWYLDGRRFPSLEHIKNAEAVS